MSSRCGDAIPRFSILYYLPQLYWPLIIAWLIWGNATSITDNFIVFCIVNSFTWNIVISHVRRLRYGGATGVCVCPNRATSERKAQKRREKLKHYSVFHFFSSFLFASIRCADPTAIEARAEVPREVFPPLIADREEFMHNLAAAMERRKKRHRIFICRNARPGERAGAQEVNSINQWAFDTCSSSRFFRGEYWIFSRISSNCVHVRMHLLIVCLHTASCIFIVLARRQFGRAFPIRRIHFVISLRRSPRLRCAISLVNSADRRA